MRRLPLALLLLAAGCAPRLPSRQGAALTGKDGAKTVAGTETVNRYTALAAPALAGDTTLAVVDATGFSANDLVLVVAAQGATFDGGDASTYGDTVSLDAAGLHELFTLAAVAGTTLTLDAGCGVTGLQNAYPLAARPQVVRVPQYSTLTVPAGTTLTGAPWDGAVGGVVAVHVEGAAAVDGTVDASALGFRGGAITLTSASVLGDVTGYRDAVGLGAEKGEGIGGGAATYDGLGGRYGRGAPINGGGGGNGYLSGGGGGAGLDGASGTAYSGQGTMSPAVTGGAAWARDPNAGDSGGPGGGRGGYSLSSADADALATDPGDVAWGGNLRRERGGLGGHPVVVASRLILGGGGGAGHFAGAALPPSPAGARGGGVVYLMADALSGGGAIRADGAGGRAGAIVGDGGFGKGGGAGGGGGGGMVVLRAMGSSSLTVSAAGGAGGTTDAGALAEFPVNGATIGDAGAVAGSLPQSSPPRACLPADVSIALADSADPVDTNASFTYTATVTNLGVNAAYDLVATISLPAGVAAGAVVAAGWSCMQAGQTLTCTRALLGAGVASTIAIGATAPAAPATVTATASVASREDPAAGNNAASEGTTIQFPRADLAIAKSAPAATASGEPFTYTLTVTNNGPRNAPALKVDDALPAQVTFVSAMGIGWTCGLVSGTVTCTRNSLASGASSAIDVVVTANALTTPTASANTAQVAITAAGVVDPVAGNNASTANTTVTPVDLSIAKVDSLDPVTAGSAITYTIAVTNPAAVAAHNVLVTDPLPAGTAFVSASGSGWTCALVSGTVRCTLPTIAAAPAATPAITVVLTAPATQGTIANTATVSSSATDPALGNNTATEQTTVSPPAPGNADVSIALVDSPDPSAPGGTLTYTASIANAGPDPAVGVQVIGTLPSGAGFVSASGAGWSCAQASSTVTCGLAAPLPVGAAPSIAIVVHAPAAGGTVTMSGVVTSSTPDPAVGNNSDVETTQVIDATQTNQPPSLTLPTTASTLEDSPVTLTGADAPTIADPDAAGEPVELRVEAMSCAISLAGTAGLTFTVGDGVLDASLVVRGTVAALDAALDGATIVPLPSFHGTAAVAFTVDDLGHTGVGGAMQATATLELAVLPVDDPPHARADVATVLADSSSARIDVLANDDAGDPEQSPTVVAVTMPAHGVAAVLADGVAYAPATGFVGDDAFTYTISDGAAQAEAKVTVHVVAGAIATGTRLGGGGLGCGVGGGHGGDGVVFVALVLAALLAGRRYRAA